METNMTFYDNWREEKRSAYLYQIMAAKESNLLHKKLFNDLHSAAEKQAASWEKKIRTEDPHLPLTFKPDLRTRLIENLINIFGSAPLCNILSAMKIRGMAVFRHAHSEHRHTGLTTANNLRAAIFGMNDGLISNLSLILGIAAAGVSDHFIILAGTAGLLAGAFSMGSGEYISVRSQREIFEYQIAIEKQELAEYPEEEIEELSYIYQARGVAKDDADKLSSLMIKNPKTGLDTLAREELGLNPEDLVSPIGAMFSSFFSFALGAFFPLLPFLFGHYLLISITLTGVTLFIMGVLLSLYTNQNPLISGGRMLMIGGIAGCLTYFIGHLW
jgi:vacuolar iron transporter family protein